MMKRIAFLGTSVYRETDGHVITRINRKPKHSDQYLVYDSHHTQLVKRGVVKRLHDWARRLLTKQSVIVGEKEQLSSVLVSNIYPPILYRRSS